MSEGEGEGGRRPGAWAVALTAAAFYFFQSSTLAPNQTDEGLILQYIDAMAHGERPFFDFVDAYGLLNWVFPVAFYKAFGDQVWGVRMWMIVLKVITVAVAYLLLRDLCVRPGSGSDQKSGRFYALLGAGWLTVLLGVQWQSLETTYAFLTVLPTVLGTWYFVLCAPLAHARRNVDLAAALTAASIWIKLNTGMFLFAGGLFAYFFLVTPEREEGSKRIPVPPWLGRARTLGVGAYGVLFLFYVRQHYSIWFFLFLTLPLTIALVWTAKATSTGTFAGPRRHIEPFVRYFGATASLSLMVLFGYYGGRSLEYARELASILSHIKYTAPFPPLGEPGIYVGLNEYYWLELPWLVTALFVVFLFMDKRWGDVAFGLERERRRARIVALFVFLTLHTFVMYARCDETHIYQALFLQAPVLFVILAQIEVLVAAARPEWSSGFRVAVGGAAVTFPLTLAVTPSLASFDVSRSDWFSPKLRHLRYRPEHNPYVRETLPNLSNHDWDIAEDQTGAYVASVTRPGEESMLLMPNRLCYFNSGTRPIGGRYHFYFYLVSVGLLDRAGFDALVPRSVVDDIMSRPPRVIVSGMGRVPLAVAFPEFQWLVDTRYVQTRHYRHIQVYELRVDGKPAPEPDR